MKKIKVYMGIPTVGTVVDFQSYMLRDIAKRYEDKIELVYPTACARRMFHDFARNSIVEDFLATDCDILWFLDSDVVPPVHILDLITKHEDWQAAGAAYPIFMTPKGEEHQQVVFTAYKGSNGAGLSATKIPDDGVEYVDGLATGCLLIKRSVFSLLTKPYFEFKFNSETREPTEGEDLGFCLKLKSLGIPFLTDYSMVCKHVKSVCLLDVNNYAMSYAKKAVAAYDAQVRGQVEALVKMVANKQVANPPQPKKSSLISLR